MATYGQHFEDWGAFVHASEHGRRVWAPNLQTSQDHNEHFRGTATYADSVRLMREGWPEGRANLHRAVSAMAARQEFGQASRWSYDVAGMVPNVPRHIAGDPYCMVTPMPTLATHTPVVRVCLNLYHFASVPAKYFTHRGAAILSIIDKLETDGIACEIMGVWRATDRGNAFAGSLIVKRAQEHMDLDRLAYVMTHPSFMRRSLFALIEQIPELERSHGQGKGSPIDVPPNEREGCLYFGRLTGTPREWSTPAAALQTAEQAFADYFGRKGDGE